MDAGADGGRVPRGVRPVDRHDGLSRRIRRGSARRVHRSESSAGVFAANFAIGAVLMMHMAKIASRFFDSAEIIELHHDHEGRRAVGHVDRDRAGHARRRAAARPFERNEPERDADRRYARRRLGGVTIHSVRLRGLVAHQEVLFGGLGQTLSIRHDTTGRDCYCRGSCSRCTR